MRTVIQKPDDKIQGSCSIGRVDECSKTGCKWKIVCGEYCWEKRMREIKTTPVPEKKENPPLKLPEKSPPVSKPVTYVPAEDTKPFYVKRRKNKKQERVEPKTDAEKCEPLPVPLKTEEQDLSKKIKVERQDDWLKKIKIVNDKKW